MWLVCLIHFQNVCFVELWLCIFTCTLQKNILLASFNRIHTHTLTTNRQAQKTIRVIQQSLESILSELKKRSIKVTGFRLGGAEYLISKHLQV